MSLLFVGGRCYGINYSNKEHMCLEAKKHSHYCPVIVTNEHNTSQTCLFYYSKTSHPQKLVTKKNKQCLRSVSGTSVCTNPDCVLRTKDETHKARDSLPALAIGLAGLSTVIFGQPIPTFDSSFNEFKAEKFKTLAKAFCTRNTFWLCFSNRVVLLMVSAIMNILFPKLLF
ncbi:hypothetical protein HMPREF1544_07354 [Mucor circinelloides 1006PhL]|uniref:Uncharacterized protein n=1 Tax=Mucor circinelloides f. circinelloides (strain 1006PhL) TaxID=1220926 RepID=S2K127_MUCC1|nr:hypothetical protein HMPREF1544_07354 [Mucor circinelloides 1006PhL]